MATPYLVFQLNYIRFQKHQQEKKIYTHLYKRYNNHLLLARAFSDNQYLHQKERMYCFRSPVSLSILFSC